MYKIVARARNGEYRPVHFEPATLEACAGVMDAMTCGNRRDARHSLRALQSYTASNAQGDMLTATWEG